MRLHGLNPKAFNQPVMLCALKNHSQLSYQKLPGTLRHLKTKKPLAQQIQA